MKIKYFLATQLFIGLLLSSCNLAGGVLKDENPSTSSTVSERKQFDANNFPLPSCRDSLPENQQAYPITLYPVFLHTPIENQEDHDNYAVTIRSEFCQDAFEEYKNSGEYGDRKFTFYHEKHQIASFLNQQNASDFQKLVVAELGENIVEVGDPVTLDNPPSNITIFNTTEEIGQAAGLTESQIEQLLSLENFQTYDGTGTIRKVKAIVPTYLPAGFQVDEFKINEWGDYSITYKNQHNACFMIYDTGLRGDAPARHETIRPIYSHALGYIDLGYTETNQLSNGFNDLTTGFDMVTIDANGQVVKGNDWNFDGGYILGFSSGFYDQNSNVHQPCEQLSLQELVKIIESLHLLNPRQKTDTQLTNNPFQSMSFPKESCGDNLPEDPNTYPVEFYPVFIDYSERNLKLAQSKFCRDSLKIYRKSLDEDYIQVSSFIGRERANQFKEFIQSEFPNVEIGEVSIIETP